MADIWTTKTALPIVNSAIQNHGVSLGGDGFVGGGSGPINNHYQYTQVSDSWPTKMILPTAKSSAAHSPIGADKYYSLVGNGGLTENQEYSKAGNSWLAKTIIPYTYSSTSIHGASFLGTVTLYLIAGGRLGNEHIDRNDEYSQSSNTWTSKISHGVIRQDIAVGAIGSDKLYLTGGTKDAGTASGSASVIHKEYSQAGNAWTLKSDLPLARGGSPFVGVGSNDGFYGGGTAELPNTPSYSAVNTNYQYAQNTNVWSIKAVLPSSRMFGAGFSLDTSKYYYIGGRSQISTGSFSDNFEYTAFDPQVFEALEDLKSFLDAEYPTAREFLKLDARAYAWLLEDLKTDAQAAALTAYEDLKTQLGANAWALTDLKSGLAAWASASEDLKLELTVSNQVFTDLKCEFKTIDKEGPYIVSAGLSPAPGQTGVPVNSNIVIKLRDDGWGVDINSLWVDVTDTVTGTTTRYKIGQAGFSYVLSSDKREAVITIDPASDFEYNRTIQVRVFALDLAGNPGLVAK